MLESPECGFKTSNNAVKYEVLLAGLMLSKKMQVKILVINSDS